MEQTEIITILTKGLSKFKSRKRRRLSKGLSVHNQESMIRDIRKALRVLRET